MCRQNCCAKSSPEEVISTDESLLIYCKPVRLYNIFHLRSLCNPSFLPRCLNYKIRAKRKRKYAHNEWFLLCFAKHSHFLVVFWLGQDLLGWWFLTIRIVITHYRKLKLERIVLVRFALSYVVASRWATIKTEGLQLHLNSSHDLFEFEFKLSEEYQTVDVSVKLDSFIFEEEASDEDKFEPFALCSKPRKRRQRSGRNNTRRLKVCFLPLDSPSLANGTENGIALLNDGNRGLGYPEATELSGQFEMTSNTPPAIARSSLDSDAKVILTSEAVVPATKTRKLSAERLEARSHLLLQKRQFYHSHRVQPMGLEQVMSDRDSEDEVDSDVADFEDRQMLDDFVDVNKNEKQFMHLWNSFVRKQRVIADGHIPWACEAFSRFHEKELHRYSSFFWCWRLFMIKLWNHGLVDASTINNCNTILENCRNSSDTNNNNSVEPPNDINNKNIDDISVNDHDNNSRDK